MRTLGGLLAPLNGSFCARLKLFPSGLIEVTLFGEQIFTVVTI